MEKSSLELQFTKEKRQIMSKEGNVIHVCKEAWITLVELRRVTKLYQSMGDSRYDIAHQKQKTAYREILRDCVNSEAA